MLSVVAFLTLVAVVVLLTTGRVSPVICLVLVPIVGALSAGFTDPVQLAHFFGAGTEKVLSVVIMFIFAILFFGLMNDVGLFDPVIDRVVALTKGKVVSVCIATVVIGAVAHLDGSGAATFLIAIPPLLPLYQRLKMDPYLLVLLVGSAASIVNMVPWGGPLGRVAVVLKADPTALWRPLIPLQIIAIVILVAMAWFLGLREQRRIAAAGIAPAPTAEAAGPVQQYAGDKRSIVKPRSITWFNRVLTLVTIGVLVWGIVPPDMTFTIAASVALLVNFPSAKDQMERIRAHSPGALTMAAILLAAGSFLGMLDGTGMLNSLAQDFVGVMPSFVSRYLHVIVGVLGIPLELIFNTDAFFFGIVPVVERIVHQYGLDPANVAYPMIIGKVTGTFICPLAPALWLALGLANLEMGKYLRYSFFWYWGLGVVLLIVAMALGIFSL